MEKQRHGGHLIAEALKAEGTEYLFTLSGGHIAPIYDGCVDAGIRIVDFRHEQAAAHAADGWARVTLQPGVAAVTAGPGVTDAVTGIANAMYANSPMLVLSGKNPVHEFEMGSLQEMDQVALVSSITKWAKTCYDVRRLPDFVATAFRVATSGRQGPVFLDVPLDVQFNGAPPDLEMPQRYRTNAKPQGDPDLVARAAALLRKASHPIVLAGAGVRWSGAHEALAEMAHALKAPVFLNSLGRGCLSPDDPYYFSAARRFALQQADVVLALGVDWDFRLGYGTRGFSPDVQVIQVDVDSVHIGRNRPVDVGVVGDPGMVIEQLLTCGVGVKEEPHWTGEVRAEEERLTNEAKPGMESDASPVHPQRFAREIRDFLDPDAIVVGDGGDIVGISASIVQARQPGHWLDPGPFGCLGVGPSFAIAAKLAKPDKQVCLIYGDGSFGLNAMEYESAIRQKIPFVGIIGNDGAWGQIKVTQESLYGEGNAPAADLDPDTPYEKMVAGLGGYGEKVTDPNEIRPALQRAFDSGVPACINVMVDPTLMKRSSYLG
ncbi:MAG TPA: acetolactate synthase [Actinobacteria bacterium]|jgi:acetolactate synthase-1/2/3 large subunit|nr:acetolactate synthase [Actinomycetota bacterium]